MRTTLRFYVVTREADGMLHGQCTDRSGENLVGKGRFGVLLTEKQMLLGDFHGAQYGVSMGGDRW